MTEGIIVAIITTVGTLLVVVLTHWLKNRKKGAATPETKISELRVDSLDDSSRVVSLIEANAVVHANNSSGGVVRDFTHKEIVAAIEAVPPFHETKMRESFIGARVSWRTRLSGIDHFNDGITVSAAIPEGSGIMFCRAASPENCDGFMLAPKDTEFIVTGEIEQISKYEAHLINCTFEILKKKESRKAKNVKRLAGSDSD